METVLVILLLISFGLMVVGLIRPSAVRVATRGKALRNYGLATLAFFALLGVILPEPDTTGSPEQLVQAATTAAAPRSGVDEVSNAAVGFTQRDGDDVGQTPFIDPRDLASGTTYRATGELPLVPEFEPADPMAAIAAIQRLEPGVEFTVLETRMQGSNPWYRVRTPVGEGWINSTALIGQETMIVR